MQQLPVGLSGLVIAGIFAAAMSTIDNGMNAIASAVTGDFYRRAQPHHEQGHYLRVARIITLAAGAVATGIAAIIARANIGSSFKFFFDLLGLFGGTLAGLFVLGLFTRRATGWGTLAGAVASIGVVVYLLVGTDFSGLLYSVFGLTFCVGVGYLVSLIGSRRKDIAGLTVYTMPDRSE